MLHKRKLTLLLCLALSLCGETKLRAVNWYWSNPMPHGNDIAALAYFNGLTIQATDNGQIYTSDDMVLWLSRTSNTTNYLQAMTILGDQLIVTGANGTVLNSSDGVNYTCTNLGTANWLVGAAASSNLAVAVGDNAVIYTSADAAHWTLQAPPPGVDGDWLQGVAWGNGTFVAVGDSGYVATSPNGTNWTQRSTLASGDLTYVAWIDTPGGTGVLATPSFVAASDTGEIIISTNGGVTWSYEPNYTTTTNALFAVSGNTDSRVVAGDGQLSLERILDGAPFWPTNNPSTPIWTYFCSLWETSPTNQYLVSGEAGFTATSTESNSIYTWTEEDNSSRSWLWQMTTNAGLYVAVGDNATVMTSDDGITWDTEAFPLTNGISISNTVFFGVGGNSNLLIAVGNSGATLLSTNQLTTVVTTNSDGSLSTNTVSTIGVVWNPAQPATTNDLQSVVCFSNQYYVCGGNGTIMSSANGSNWTRQTTPNTNYLSGLAVYPGGMVAVGDQGTILTSPNGSTWTEQASGITNWIFRVHYLGDILIAAGEAGCILTSRNGTAWVGHSSGTTNWLNDVTMVTNMYFIVGNQGTVLGSTNATTWTNTGIITVESLFGAATQNGQLVVAGDSGSILQTQIVPQTTQLEFLDFAYTTNEAVFLVGPTNNAIDLQFTIDSSTNLLNWNTGPVLDLTSGALFFYLPLTNTSVKQYYRTTLTTY